MKDKKPKSRTIRVDVFFDAVEWQRVSKFYTASDVRSIIEDGGIGELGLLLDGHYDMESEETGPDPKP